MTRSRRRLAVTFLKEAVVGYIENDWLLEIGRTYFHQSEVERIWIMSTAISLVTKPVPLRTDDAGVLRVGDTRVSLDSVLAAFNTGSTAEEIVQQYDVLALADVYSVLGYYLDNQHEFDSYLATRKTKREQLRQELETRYQPQGIRQRLLARRNIP